MKFRIDHLERVRRPRHTVAHLMDEVLAAKRWDGRSEVYLRDLRYRPNKFVQDFGDRPIERFKTDSRVVTAQGVGSERLKANGGVEAAGVVQKGIVT